MDLLALGIALHWWSTKEERAERKARRKAGLEKPKDPPYKVIFIIIAISILSVVLQAFGII